MSPSDSMKQPRYDTASLEIYSHTKIGYFVINGTQSLTKQTVYKTVTLDKEPYLPEYIYKTLG